VERIGTVGRSDCSSCVRSTLPVIITNKMVETFNWSGAIPREQNKRAFRSSALLNVVYGWCFG